MRKILTLATVMFLAALVIGVPVFAQSIPQIQTPVVFPDLETFINFLLGLIRPVVLLVLILTLMYGGFVYLTAQDDDSKVASAKKIMTAAIVGFVIIVLAPVMVQLVGAFLGIRQGFLDVGI